MMQRSQGDDESGFVTLCVLAMAFAIFLALGAALKANYRIHDLNKRQADAIQQRADDLHTPEATTGMNQTGE